MTEETIQAYLKKFNQTFSLANYDCESSASLIDLSDVLYIDLTEEDLCKQQQDFADMMMQENVQEDGIFYSAALILYGYRLGVVRLKDKNECFTRQGGYKDNAISTYSLDEILNIETKEDVPETCTSNIIEWIINPKSNTDVPETLISKMIIPLIKNLCKITPPGKQMDCTIIMPPISKEIEIDDWSNLFAGVKVNNLKINITNYGKLLSLDESSRKYIMQYQTDGYREFVIISAYEVIRGHNTCLGCLAFDINNQDETFILKDIDHVSFHIDNQRTKRTSYNKIEKEEPKNEWDHLQCKYSVNSGFNSFLGNHSASFGRELYKLSGINDYSHFGAKEVKKAFHGNEALQVVEVCSILVGEQNLYNISLGDLVYVSNILERDKAFKKVSIKTANSYRLGTFKKFDSNINIKKFPLIPANYNTFSWSIRNKSKRLIPYFNLDVDKHNKIEIIESVVQHFEHCTAEIVADELLYFYKNGEDPSAFFVAKVFMFMSQMESLVIESCNDNITTIENVDNVVYQEIDKSNITLAKSILKNKQKSDTLKMTIEELNFKSRTFNCLKRAGIRTVFDIVKMSYKDLSKIRNLGKDNQKEIVLKINKLGYHLAEK